QRLHPNVLDDFGLEGAIEWHVKQIRDQTGLDIQYRPPPVPLPPVDRETAIHFYRVLQEALSNVGKHSTAETAEVRLSAENGQALREVEDHGSGFSPEPGGARGCGMVAMRERAQLIGGALTIGPLATGRTRVRLQAPTIDRKT